MEKGGLAVALAEAGLRRGDEVYASDEMRLGLRGTVRRVLAPKGVKVVQTLQLRYEWSYLVLAVDPKTGELRWRSLGREDEARRARIGRALGVGFGGADLGQSALAPGQEPAGAPHQAGVLAFLQPRAQPPAERIFEEVRRRVEGRAYESIGAKQAEVESYLRELGADRERVKRLCGWEWMREALEQLPSRRRSMAARR